MGELTKGPHVIKACNVHLGVNKNKILFLLISFKTHDKGCKPQLVKISQKPIKDHKKSFTAKDCEASNPKWSNKFNPFNLVSAYIEVRPNALNNHEQFFVFQDNSPMLPEHLRAHLHKALKNIRMNAHLYNVHSLRIGRCGDLLKLGVSIENIKKIGHWRSNAVFTYLRQ